MLPNDLLFTKTHEWVKKLEDGTASVGLTDHAQGELGDLVFINLPSVGDSVDAGEAFADVESVKAVSDIYSPVSGTVLEVNEELIDAPELINQDAFGTWIMKVSDPEGFADLLDADAYAKLLEEE